MPTTGSNRSSSSSNKVWPSSAVSGCVAAGGFFFGGCGGGGGGRLHLVFGWGAAAGVRGGRCWVGGRGVLGTAARGGGASGAAARGALCVCDALPPDLDGRLVRSGAAQGPEPQRALPALARHAVRRAAPSSSSPLAGTRLRQHPWSIPASTGACLSLAFPGGSSHNGGGKSRASHMVARGRAAARGRARAGRRPPPEGADGRRARPNIELEPAFRRTLRFEFSGVLGTVILVLPCLLSANVIAGKTRAATSRAI